MEPFAIAFSILTMVIGAILGVVFTRIQTNHQNARKRKDPVDIKVWHSGVPPTWFATNRRPPSSLENAQAYEEEVANEEPFCAFAKINLEIANSSNDVIYIDDIPITKKPAEDDYKFRVRTIPQGVCEVTRLFADLDDELCHFSLSLTERQDANGNFFEYGFRIKIAPGESERVFLVLTCFERAWDFNCDLVYSIAGEQRCSEHILGDNQTIVPYRPGEMEMDYCAFLEAVDPEYERFGDAHYFERDASSDEGLFEGVPLAALEYIEREAG